MYDSLTRIGTRRGERTTGRKGKGQTTHKWGDNEFYHVADYLLQRYEVLERTISVYGSRK